MWSVELKKNLTCPLEEYKELAPLSSLGVGGVTEFFVEPSKLKDISEIFKIRSKLDFPLYILGGGTNVVFADGILKGIVLSTRRMDSAWWSTEGDFAILEAEAGVPVSSLVSMTTEEGFSGAEFAQGLPGTVGGAVAGNAGAGGENIGELLEEVTTVESDGSIRKWVCGEFEYSYRRFLFKSTSSYRAIVSCKMKFKRAPYTEIERRLEVFRNARCSQPRGVKSVGCTFKNPPEDSAGRLLDVCGCKGLREGDAIVSAVHANFIINSGAATGGEVLKLMKSCRDIVFQETGIQLEPEIQFLGFPG